MKPPSAVAPRAPVALALLAAFSALACGSPRADRVAHGQKLYQQTCAFCHGGDAKGMRGLGKGLLGNEFIAARSERELVDFLKIGRRPDDPGNDTGVDMPPRGGNQGLRDEDLAAIAAYLKTLPSH